MSSPDDQNLEFTVVKGSPTEEELAAVVTVLTTQFSQQRQGEETPGQSGWSAYWRSVRSPLQPGPTAWRMSGRPQ
jgi:Acyl-CoA carboxylase epsilon subunit